MPAWFEGKKPIIGLSPMADMTDSVFCRVVKRRGDPIIFREMVSAEAVCRAGAKTLEMTAFAEEERPIVLQIFGADPARMAEAVQRLEELRQPDGFDINMGCPVRKMTCQWNGASLMREPEKASAVVRAAQSATRLPVSVKTRLGWSRPDEILDFIRVLEDAGADLVTVHGRTREQGYAGQADWTAVGRAKALVKIPVLVNGDIISGTTAKQALAASGCDGLLVGRGALGHPWVFAEIAAVLAGRTWTPPTDAEIIAAIREHAFLYAESRPKTETEPLVTFRKHLLYYFHGRPNAREWREKLVRVATLADLDGVLDEWRRDGVTERRSDGETKLFSD